jgi:uncharacterized membrane protein (UPF0127 family)
MRIVNVTRQTVLAERAWRAVRLKDRLRGLLGREGLEAGEALYLEPCTSIHSFFMRFAFDAIFLDRHFMVTHLIENMPPWRISRWVPRARGVIELPAGTVRRTMTAAGDKISFIETG